MFLSKIDKQTLVVTALIAIATLMRLVPHLPNFTPVTAVALFGGYYFTQKRMAYTLPLLIMFLSDLILGLSAITFFVYAAFMLVSFIGINAKRLNIFSILISSLSFFIITNFGVWVIGYPKTWDGLISCYTLALPFFRNSLLGDLFYSGLMVLIFNLVNRFYLQQVR